MLLLMTCTRCESCRSYTSKTTTTVTHAHVLQSDSVVFRLRTKYLLRQHVIKREARLATVIDGRSAVRHEYRARQMNSIM